MGIHVVIGVLYGKGQFNDSVHVDCGMKIRQTMTNSLASIHQYSTNRALFVPEQPLFSKVLMFQVSVIFIQQSLSKREIEDLLRKGAYGAIMEEENDDSSK